MEPYPEHTWLKLSKMALPALPQLVLDLEDSVRELELRLERKGHQRHVRLVDDIHLFWFGWFVATCGMSDETKRHAPPPKP